MAFDVAQVLGRRTGTHFAGTCAAGSLTWFANHELRLAWRDWLSMMTAGRRERGRMVAIALVAFVIFAHVLAWYFVARYVEESAEPIEARAGGHHRQRAARLVAVAVAGDGVGDARLLLALRSRPHSLLPGRRTEDLRGAHRRDGALGDPDGGAARRAADQRAGAARRRALARRLRRGRRDGCDGRGARGRAHRRAVPHHRAEAHAACRADRRRRDRGSVHHRPASGRDPVARHAVAHGVSGIRHAGRAGSRRSTASCGGRRAPRSAI